MVRTRGYRRAQLTRLVARWSEIRLSAAVLTKSYLSPTAPITRKYGALDIELLVAMDRASEDVSCLAIVYFLQSA